MIFQPTSLTSAKAGSWAHQNGGGEQAKNGKTPPKTNKPGSLRWLSCFEFLLPVGNAISITFFVHSILSIPKVHTKCSTSNLPILKKQLNFAGLKRKTLQRGPFIRCNFEPPWAQQHPSSNAGNWWEVQGVPWVAVSLNQRQWQQLSNCGSMVSPWIVSGLLSNNCI